MTYKGTFPDNFKNLIIGRSTLNVADSFYDVAVTIGLVNVYAIEASRLSTFTLLSMIPPMLAFIYSPLLDRMQDTKRWLVTFQLLHIALVIGILWCFRLELSILVLYALNFVFYLVNSMLAALEVRVVPEALNNDEPLIERSVDIQYFAMNTLDIISNFMASLLLGVMTYTMVLDISLPIFLAGVYFFLRLRLPRHERTVQADPEQCGSPHYIQEVKTSIKQFFSEKETAMIILIEAFLSGAIDLLLALVPLYLIHLDLDVKWLGVVLACQRGSDLLGAMIAPRIHMEPKNFFSLDYLISGSAMLGVFLIKPLILKLILFIIAFVVIGISGNIFKKMIYRDYDTRIVGSIYTTITSCYSIFGIIFMLIPYVYDNVIALGIIFNVMTIVFGLVILFHRYQKQMQA